MELRRQLLALSSTWIAPTVQPSNAALGWLETSIRAYPKYCDTAAKATAHYEHEQNMVRRERLPIEQVRQLLPELVDCSLARGCWL